MQRARTFFYVSAGVFLFALAYHLGAVGATAQTSSPIEAANCYDVPGIVYEPKLAVINRVVYALGGSGSVTSVAEPIPGTARAIAVGNRGVILENGEIWSHDSGAWQLEGTFPALGPTPTQPTTFGAIKAKFRR